MSKCWSCGAKVERQPNYCHGCHHVVCLACIEKYDHIGYGGKHGRRPTKRAPDAPKQCDVTDLQGNHCPEEALHTVIFDGVETHLCERCYKNVLAGAYGSHLTQRPPDAATPWCVCESPKFELREECACCGKPPRR